MRIADCGEYVRLGVITGRRQEIVDWLTITAPCEPLNDRRTAPPPPDLPDVPPRHWESAPER
jgi:hypothetical protein